MTTTFLVSRFPCGCLATIMVVDKDTPARDRAGVDYGRKLAGLPALNRQGR